jgi:hypothetical protein
VTGALTASQSLDPRQEVCGDVWRSRRFEIVGKASTTRTFAPIRLTGVAKRPIRLEARDNVVRLLPRVVLFILVA